MQKVNVREARQHIGRLLDAVSTGEEILIVRRGRPIAKLVRVDSTEASALFFPDRSDLRKKLPPGKKPSRELIREMRNERY